MTYVVPITLETFPPGLLIVQKERNIEAFVTALQNSGIFKVPQIEELRQYYSESGRGLRGFCEVRNRSDAWVVLAFGKDLETVRRTMVHELVHLGENLSLVSGIAIGPEGNKSQEIRARLVQTVYDKFCQDVPRLFPTAPPALAAVKPEPPPDTPKPLAIAPADDKPPKESILEIIVYVFFAGVVGIGLAILQAKLWP
jgi:hypothetical protein